ncbi:MAG: hypothetical protein KGH66_00405 [Candidatus Micrarchaeota archaeon]|nr:hypothetical protein [Candidatus Micrarchaeota archaeon]
MSKKLGLNPDVCYMLGVYKAYKREEPCICLETDSEKLVERFVQIAVQRLDVKPEKLLIESTTPGTKAMFYNSKLKRLFEEALEDRERIFKYKNEYSASYMAALFDTGGWIDGKGIFIRGDKMDFMLLERLGFHTTTRGAKCYLRNGVQFMAFIKPYSIKLIDMAKTGRRAPQSG